MKVVYLHRYIVELCVDIINPKPDQMAQKNIKKNREKKNAC